MEKKKTKNTKKTLVIVLCVVLAVLILAVAGFAVWYFTQAQEVSFTDEEVALFEELQAALNEGVFVEGITIDGVDVSGMTKAEAKAAISEAHKEQLNELEYTFEIEGEEYVIKQSNSFNVLYNTTVVIEEAFNCIDISDTRTAIDQYADIKTNGKEFFTTVEIHEQSLRDSLEQLSSKFGAEPKDATYKINYDAPEGEKVEIVEGQSGVTIDTEAMYTAITEAFAKGESAVLEVAAEVVEPEVTKEELEGKLTYRAGASTSYNTAGLGYETRAYNVEKATGLINEILLAPGERLSMNDTLGDRTYANGWREGGALVNGTTETQAGGGVCQVATTLYNAVVKSDLEIVYRRNHSEQSSYVAGGLDATINTGTIDFIFANNTESDILIVAYNKDKHVYIEIYGEAWGEEYDNIKLTSKQTAVVYPDGETKYEVVKGKSANYKEVKVKRKNGSKWISYKNYYKGDTLVKTEILAESTYKAYAGITLIGEGSPLDPNATATPSPTKTETAKPSPTKAETVTPTPTPTPVPDTGNTDQSGTEQQPTE